MKRTLTLAVAGALLATLLSTTVAAAAAPSNDLHTGAIALSDALPQTVTADTTEATVTTDDFGCGAGGVDQASVWYSIAVTDGFDVLIDPTASSYLVGVNVYINSPGQENLVTCFQGPGLVTLQARRHLLPHVRRHRHGRHQRRRSLGEPGRAAATVGARA